LLSLFITISGFFAKIDQAARILQILFLPVTFYLLYALILYSLNKGSVFDRKPGAKRILIYYCFIVTTILVGIGFFSARNSAQLISSLIFSPMVLYFLILVWPHREQALPLKKSEIKSLVASQQAEIDIDRRTFLKLIGSAGILALILGLFGRRAGISNFLGGPNLSSVSLKDASGNVIEPAAKSPTDGYNISQVDDSVPAYFGFVDKNGKWFIMREGEDGSFRYARGETDFSTNWVNRHKLIYDLFDRVFY